MIDLHCHLLPGIDDGPDTLDQSLELCAIAVKDGIKQAIVTPHIHPGRWENSRASIERATSKLEQELKARKMPLALGFAGEVRLSEEIIGQVERNEIPFYGKVDGYNVMLLEFPHGHIIPGSEKLVEWLMGHSIKPLIAHPERNKQLMKDPQQLIPYVEAGCMLQVTAGSLLGKFGPKAQDLSRSLLSQGLVSVIASDGHNRTARPPTLSAAREYVERHFGEDCARRLLCTTPAAIAANQLKRSNEF